MNRTDRLVAMVTYLQGRRVVRAEELATHFEVSARTIYRDVAALCESGVPIVGEAGVGYSLVKGYHLPPVMFTAEEAMALAVGEDLVKQFTDQSMAAPMTTALLKIRSVLSREHQDDLDRLGASLAIEGRCKLPAGLEQRTLLPIQQAVLSRRVVALRYRARDGRETQRQIEPVGVVYYGDAWYLVAWCRLRGEYRHFRLERVLEMQVLPERFAPRSDATLRDHLRDAKNQVPTYDVRVLFHPAAVPRARRESFTGFLDEKPTGDGGVAATLRTYSLEWIARWILSFGPDAEVLEPADLRQRVGELARAVAENYAEATVS